MVVFVREAPRQTIHIKANQVKTNDREQAYFDVVYVLAVREHIINKSLSSLSSLNYVTDKKM